MLHTSDNGFGRSVLVPDDQPIATDVEQPVGEIDHEGFTSDD